VSGAEGGDAGSTPASRTHGYQARLRRFADLLEEAIGWVHLQALRRPVVDGQVEVTDLDEQTAERGNQITGAAA